MNVTKKRAIKTALFALARERGPKETSPAQTSSGGHNHIWLALFTGAACTNTSHPFGAYAITFHDYTPAAPATHRKSAKMAWYMPDAVQPEEVPVSEKRLSGLAVAQALYVVDQRLRALPDAEGGRPKRATVKVFTSCVETLKDVHDPGRIRGDTKEGEAQLGLVKLVEDLSKKLCGIEGVTVRIVLQWLPADYGKLVGVKGFARHCRKRRIRKDTYFVESKEVKDLVMPEGVSALIGQNIVEEDEVSKAEEAEVAMATEKKTVTLADDVEMEDVEESSSFGGQVVVDKQENHDEEMLDVADDTAFSEQVLVNQQISIENNRPGQSNEEVYDEQMLIDQQTLGNMESSEDEQVLIDQQILADSRN